MNAGIRRWLNKNVGIVVEIGNATIRLEGKVHSITKDWITIKTKDGLKTIGKGYVILIEEK